ncbi:monovalent cation/H(+) antiporter subunit G [Sandaracinus amylolyticus]|uniref:monovalent cation/H(+) antiporter subunit G n=1 Tax=Sandaracinus amylolyticus TaxID=927083 RepID=UPI001F40C8FF|nr:monovalent cation/H(+) antiporter subunit G [Sandaracinus amylolyticus]UJR83009.1 Hypothetical protein I5071_50740 [Sandaracinus amylolyticus]
MIASWIASVLLTVGSAFVLIASIGVARLPDLYTRMQAATKGGAVGLAFLMGAVALALQRAEATVLVALLIAFVMLTAPVAAHAIGRAGYLNGVPLWEGTRRDDLRRARERS